MKELRETYFNEHNVIVDDDDEDVIQQRIFAEDVAESVGLSGELPSTAEEEERVQEALEKKLRQLSMEEQERGVFDIHGISTEDEETEAKLSAALEELQNELSRLPMAKKRAYERARKLKASFVEDRAFLLMFLRAERFKAKQAAAVVAHHFELKYEFFIKDRKDAGVVVDEGILVRDIRWSDLDAEDRNFAISGFFQVSPKRDASGRTIVFQSQTHLDATDVRQATRAYWYMGMWILKEEATQKTGVVKVVFNFRDRPDGFSFVKEVRRTEEAMPFLIVSGHYCHRNASFSPIVKTYRLLALDKYIDSRMITHCGDPKDVAFQLQTYGIPIENSPLTDTGTISNVWHLQWLEMLQKLDARSLEEEVSSLAIVPRQFDVLFGKTKQIREHTGNLRCQYLVDMHWGVYESISRTEKIKVTDHIISLIHQSQGRFLRMDSGIWVEVNQREAREKVSHFFRHRRSQLSSATSAAGAVQSTKATVPLRQKRVLA